MTGGVMQRFVAVLTATAQNMFVFTSSTRHRGFSNTVKTVARDFDYAVAIDNKSR